LSLEARVVSEFISGKPKEEIAKSLGLSVKEVEEIISRVLSADEEEDETRFEGFEKELMGLYQLQKRRVMRYVRMEEQMRMPIVETKDNLLLLLKMLEALWKIKGGGPSVERLKAEIFGVAVDED
jgi:hypothetical protein